MGKFFSVIIRGNKKLGLSVPHSNSLSDSGRELVIDELVDVIVVSD